MSVLVPLCTEVMIGSTWTDLTSLVYTRDGINITRGRADESANVEPSTMTLTMNNRNGALSPRNPTGTYYGLIGRNTPIRQSVIAPGYLQIIGPTDTTPAGGAYVTTPDNAALDLTGQIDFRFDASLTTWRETMELMTKWDNTTNNRSYAFVLLSSGKLYVAFSTNGTNQFSVTSKLPVPVTSGRITVRAVFNPAGSCTFYTTTTGVNTTDWTQLGDVVTFGATSVFSGTARFSILDDPNSALAGSVIRGKVHQAQLRNASNVVVANADFSVVANNATSFTDSVSRVWTLNGLVAVSTRDIRFTGEIPSWPQAWDISGNDVYTQLTANGVLRRLGQGNEALHSALFRGISKSAKNLMAYWPVEDGDGATAVASALPGKFAMHVNGAPDFAGNQDFLASDSIAGMNKAVFTSRVVTTGAASNSSQTRFVMSVPAAGETNGVKICTVTCGGTASTWVLTYGTGGSMALTAFDNQGNNLGGTGPISFAVNGAPMRVSIELTDNGANCAYAVTTLTQGATTGAQITGTITGKTVRPVTKVVINDGGGLTDTAIGHVTVQSSIDSIYSLFSEFNGFVNEAAGRRVERLCQEEGIVFEGRGDLDDSVLMGPQTPSSLTDLFDECVDADFGILYEPRDQYGLGYWPHSALFNQMPVVTLDYAQSQLATLNPIEDDQLLRNDVTVTRPNGSSARSTVDTGRLSTQAPPNGVGRYSDSVTVNVATDDVLDDQAAWRTYLGTLDQARYPTINVNLSAPEFTGNAALSLQALTADIGFRLVVTNPPAWLPPDAISQLIQGSVEHMDQYVRTLAYNCSPEAPWEVVAYANASATTASQGRYSSDGSVTFGTYNTTQTGVFVVTASGPIWSFSDGTFDMVWAGEVVRVTAISGTTSPQTFTVTRSINGVVKSHVNAETIELATPAHYAL